MSTLIKNVGILDVRKASPEQIREIGKIVNVGCLVTSAESKAQLLKVNLQNIGKLAELDLDYKLHTGPLEITRAMLESSEQGVKLCVVGPLSVDGDIPVELLQAKLAGLYLIGPASVPKHLYGAFMSSVKEITGPVSASNSTGKKTTGKITITNEYLNSLEDATELSIAGNLTFAEEVDPELFDRKIASIKVVGQVKCLNTQEEMMRKALVESEATRVRIIQVDFHYVPGGTMLDTFTIMTVNKQTVSCPGLLILDDDVTEELIRQKNIRFEAGTLYFPKTVMHEMVARLAPKTRGIPYEVGRIELVTGEQALTSARLEAMQDRTALLVVGTLEVDDDLPLDGINAKIAVLDNYGEITANRDIASILQGKLRQNEGSIRIKDDEAESGEDEGYDTVIENMASYSL